MCTQSRNQYWVAHHTLHEGKEPQVEVGRGTTKLDLGHGGQNQGLGVVDRVLGASFCDSSFCPSPDPYTVQSPRSGGREDALSGLST